MERRKVMKARTQHFRFCLTVLLVLFALTVLMEGTAHAQCQMGNRPRPDFNGDCRADLAVGSPGPNRGPFLQAGTVQIIYGTVAGLGAANTQVFGAENCRLSQVGAVTGTSSGLHFGSVLSWGDFNGDRIDDLAVGMPDFNPPYAVGGMPG